MIVWEITYLHPDGGAEVIGALSTLPQASDWVIKDAPIREAITPGAMVRIECVSSDRYPALRERKGNA